MNVEVDLESDGDTLDLDISPEEEASLLSISDERGATSPVLTKEIKELDNLELAPEKLFHITGNSDTPRELIQALDPSLEERARKEPIEKTCANCLSSGHKWKACKQLPLRSDFCRQCARKGVTTEECLGPHTGTFYLWKEGLAPKPERIEPTRRGTKGRKRTKNSKGEETGM